MEMIFIFTFCLILAGADAVTTVTGYRGRSVHIKCSYTSGYENVKKYLCKGNCPTWDTDDVPVQSGSPAKDSRFSLYDDKTAKVFTITITDLRPKDQRTYWCGIEQAGRDIYKEILLLVKMDDHAISTVSHTTHPHTPQTSSSVHAEIALSTSANLLTELYSKNIIYYFSYIAQYVLISTGAVLFAVGVIIAIYCKNKCQASKTVTQSCTETNGDKNLLPLQARGKDNLPESAYQSLDPATNQSDSVYQSLTSI